MDDSVAPRPPSKRRAWLFTILGLVLVVVILVGIKASQIMAMIGAGKHFVLPPESVTSAKVEEMTWPSSRTAVATLVAVHSVTISSELTGTVRQLGFESGATVKRGDLLIKMDTSTEDAQLDAAEAERSLAKVTLTRQDTLRKHDANTAADLDFRHLTRASETEANSGGAEIDHREEDHPSSLRRENRHQASRVGRGAFSRNRHRGLAIGHADLCRLLASAAGDRRPARRPIRHPPRRGCLPQGVLERRHQHREPGGGREHPQRPGPRDVRESRRLPRTGDVCRRGAHFEQHRAQSHSPSP